jgi:delta14-sterol reductase/lamin-B receptor
MNGLSPLIWLADHYFQLASAGIIFCSFFAAVLFLYSHRSKNVIVAAGANSGWHLYDLWMGRELNPRIFNGLVDLKFVCELRPGLIGWFILNLAFAAKQYSLIGTVTNSMILVLIGQGYYVFDAIWNEKAILTTMDITTDGFGFMLLFGDLVWVPFTYALQAKYLSINPQYLTPLTAASIFGLNLLGLYIFRSSNSEKNAFRNNPDQPSVAHLKYMTTKRGTKLLVSGWWGMARKINYTGTSVLFRGLVHGSCLVFALWI